MKMSGVFGGSMNVNMCHFLVIRLVMIFFLQFELNK